MQAISHYLFFWRCIVYGLLFFSWPRLIQWAGQKRQWNTEVIELIAAKKYGLILFFVSMEILVMRNGLNNGVHFMAGLLKG